MASSSRRCCDAIQVSSGTRPAAARSFGGGAGPGGPRRTSGYSSGSGSLTTGGPRASVFSVFFLLVIIVVGVSRWHRVDHDGDGTPVGEPGEHVLGDAQGHVGSCCGRF